MQTVEGKALRQAYEAVAGALEHEPEALLASVANAIERARAAHPAFDFALHGFVARIAGIAGSDAGAAAVIDALVAGDLLLAHAALAGDRAALSTLDALLLHEVRPAVQRRSNGDDTRADEVLQRVRVRMLVGDGSSGGKLNSYNAKGTLAAWARTMAVRLTYDLFTDSSSKPAEALESALIQAAVATNHDPALLALLDRSAPLLASAMGEAVRQLSRRDRYLLRASLVDGSSIDEIGAFYNQHRSTVARWIVKAKQTLHDNTMRAFCELAQVSESDFMSIMRALPSYFDMSLERRLSEPSDSGD
jgi:RNA polymerase sigma-70 factor (ECF subfamily)